MFESIIEGYNEYYSAELSVKIRRGLKESRIKGNFTGGKVMYGYDIVGKKWVVNERETEIVRKIFTDCSQGVLLKNIAAELNGKGVKTKAGGSWTIGGVSHILNNERYCGTVRIGGEVYANIIPPIIDEALYKKVSGNMAANCRRTSHFKSPIPFYLSGKLLCMHCGSPIHGESGTGRANVYYYYKCQSNKRNKGACPKKVVKRNMLEDYIIDKIEQYILQRKYIMAVAKDMTDNFNARIKSGDGLNLLKWEQAQNDKELNNTLVAIRMGVVTQSTKEMLEQLEEQKERLAVEIAKLSSRRPKIIDVNDCADFLFSLTALDFSIAENRKLLFDHFIRRVELGNRKIRIFFNPVDKPYLYSEKEDDLEPTEREAEKEKAPAESDNTFIGGSSGVGSGGDKSTKSEPRCPLIFSNTVYRKLLVPSNVSVPLSMASNSERDTDFVPSL
jgi:hypothetical protein